MRLSDVLFETLLPEKRGFISITGGGGKTTLLSLLGKKAAEAGCSVLLTTTTKVASPYLHDYKADTIFGDESILAHVPEKGRIVFYSEHHTLDMKKWIAPRDDVLTVLYSHFDVIIAEADGSRGLPLKIHTERDPVIHPLTTAVISVMGLWGIGGKAYAEAFGEDRDIIINGDYLQWYLNAPEGLCKGFVNNNAVVFNGAENVDDDVMKMLSGLSYPADTKAYAASEMEDRIYGFIC